jgi:hypothetical protein
MSKVYNIYIFHNPKKQMMLLGFLLGVATAFVASTICVALLALLYSIEPTARV